MPRKLVEGHCEWCGAVFRARGDQRFCSRLCGVQANKPPMRVCPLCGAWFYTIKPDQRTCSKRCGALARAARPPTACRGCGTVFVPRGRRVTYCSPECLAESRRARCRAFNAGHRDDFERREADRRRWALHRAIFAQAHADATRGAIERRPEILELVKEQDQDGRRWTVQPSWMVSLDVLLARSVDNGRSVPYAEGWAMPDYLVAWDDPTFDQAALGLENYPENLETR